MTEPLTLEFSLTDEEASVAASRAAWRASLAGGLTARHFAPLAAFALAVLFAAILGWTGLVSRRAAEIALIVSAAAYMVWRLWTRRRFLSARRAANAWAATVRAAAPARLALDEQGFALDLASTTRRWRFADGLEIEEVAGLVYVWPTQGEPLFWPARAHGDEEAARFLDLARRRAGSRRRGRRRRSTTTMTDLKASPRKRRRSSALSTPLICSAAGPAARSNRTLLRIAAQSRWRDTLRDFARALFWMTSTHASRDSVTS